MGSAGDIAVAAPESFVTQDVVDAFAPRLHTAWMLMIGSMTYGVGSFESSSDSESVFPTSVQCVPFGVMFRPRASRITGLSITIPETL